MGDLRIISNNKIEYQTILDDNYKQIDIINGLNISLYPHQRAAIQALIDIEEARGIYINSENELCKYKSISNIFLQTNAVVLSEPFGSGKTIELLGWILSRRLPLAYPINANYITLNKYLRSEVNYVNQPINCISREYNSVITPTLILVGATVFIQWQNAIKNYTNLNILCISNYYHLCEFQTIFNNNTYFKYDIILVKNGTVSGEITINNQLTSYTNKSIINLIGLITDYKCWARVIYDDFDTIKIPPGSIVLNALFTCYVSTTKNQSYNKHRTVEYNNIYELINSEHILLSNVLNDKLLFTNFNIQNNIQFIKQGTSMPIIEKYLYVYSNPINNYLRLIGEINDNNTNNILEMLNGDAINTAANAVGLNTNNVGDIFKRILDNKYNEHLLNCNILQLIVKLQQSLINLPNGNYTIIESEKIRDEILKNKNPKLKYNNDTICQLLIELHNQVTINTNRTGVSINRVIDNVKEGSCQICTLPLENVDAFIMRCCGLILCDICGIKGTQFKKQIMSNNTQPKIIGKCANCRSPVYPLQDMIFVDKKININDLIDTHITDIVYEKYNTDNQIKTGSVTNCKFQTVIDIINSVDIKTKQKININTTGVIEGTINKPQNNIVKKILVFASYNETLNKLSNILNINNISYFILRGGVSEISRIVSDFNNITAPSLLLINTQERCAGLNLTFATDVCFMHKILNPHIEAQLIGRAQRIGRTCNLNIHYISYENEENLYYNT